MVKKDRRKERPGDKTSIRHSVSEHGHGEATRVSTPGYTFRPGSTTIKTQRASITKPQQPQNLSGRRSPPTNKQLASA